MADADEIIRFAEQVAQHFKPQRIVLFGSYAYGSPTSDSDVDMLVIMDFRGSNHRQAVRIREAIAASFALDLLVRSGRDVARRIGWNDFFLMEVMQKGLVIYAADDPRVGAQGRRRLRRRLAAAAVAQAQPV